MATNSDYITRALKKIGVLAESESPSAEQGSDALVVMNDMFAVWESEGIDVGWKPSASTTDTIDFHPAVREAVVTNLAARLCADYAREPSAVLATLAVRTYEKLLREAINAKVRGVPMWHIPLGEGRMDSGNILTGVE